MITYHPLIEKEISAGNEERQRHYYKTSGLKTDYNFEITMVVLGLIFLFLWFR